MAKNITLMGASYSDVPAVDLPQTGGGTARFVDTSDANASQYSLLEGATAYVNGEKITGVIPEMTSSGMSGDIGYYYFDEDGERKWGVEGHLNANNGGVVYPGARFDTGVFTFNAIPANTVITPTSQAQTVGGANWMMEGPITINASTGTSKNVQIAQGVSRVNTTAYTAVSGQTLTVAKTGKYDIYWSGYRSSTSGTSGSQLYIGETAYGSAQTTFSNHGQSVHLTNVSLTKDDVITVRARARNTSYYMYVANLTIIEA